MSSPPDPAGEMGARGSAATMARILASAEVEFGSKGLEATKVDDIARAAGISKQLIYHYFKGKDDLFSELMLHLSRHNLEILCAVDYLALAPIDAASAFFETIFELYRNNRFATTITLDFALHGGTHIRNHPKIGKLRDDLHYRFGESLERGKAAGVIRPEIDVAAAHFLALVLVSGSLTLQPLFARITRREESAGAFDRDEVRQQFTGYFMRALCV